MASDADPTIEVVIAATTDKLSGGLKTAEAMIVASTTKMADTAEAANLKAAKAAEKAAEKTARAAEKAAAAQAKAAEKASAKAEKAAAAQIAATEKTAAAEKASAEKAIASAEKLAARKEQLAQREAQRLAASQSKIATASHASLSRELGSTKFDPSKITATVGADLGKAGADAGGKFTKALVAKMAGVGAIIATLGSSLRAGVEAWKAGDPGKSVGAAMLQGVVDGAKSLPIVGALVDVLEYELTGAAEAAAVKAAELGRKVAEDAEKVVELNQQRNDARASLRSKSLDIQSRGDPIDQARRENQKEVEDLTRERDTAMRASTEAFNAAQKAMGATQREIESANATHIKTLLDAQKDYARARAILEKEIVAKVDDIQEQARLAEVAEFDERAEKRKAADEKSAQAAEKAAAEVAKKAAEALKRQQELAIRGMEDRLEVLKDASAASRGARLGDLADKAASPLIRSGQTALGQFNFAGGSADQAMRNAEDQLQKLEAIESLQREMRDYQRKIAEGIAA